MSYFGRTIFGLNYSAMATRTQIYSKLKGCGANDEKSVKDKGLLCIDLLPKSY